MIYDQHIVVTSEPNHPVIWEFHDNGQPYDVTGRVYQMVIRRNEDATPHADDVTFACTVTANRVECVGDCSTLQHGIQYNFQLVENGIAIITGKATPVPRYV